MTIAGSFRAQRKYVLEYSRSSSRLIKKRRSLLINGGRRRDEEMLMYGQKVMLMRNLCVCLAVMSCVFGGAKTETTPATDNTAFDPCMNRSFAPNYSHSCTNNYLPRIGQLQVLSSEPGSGATGRKAANTAAQMKLLQHQGKENDDDPHQPTTFMLLMQAGRVGSTWLREMLDSHHKISCEREIFNDHPCSGENSRVRHGHQMRRFVCCCCLLPSNVVVVVVIASRSNVAAVPLCLVCCWCVYRRQVHHHSA